MSDLGDWNQIDQICDRFESECKRREYPHIEDLVGTLNGETRHTLTIELLKLELGDRRSHGERPVRDT